MYAMISYLLPRQTDDHSIFVIFYTIQYNGEKGKSPDDFNLVFKSHDSTPVSAGRSYMLRAACDASRL